MSSREMSKANSKKDQAINEQRKKLEELRLQTQSQNTKLLKIQQKERQVQAQYLNEKKNMEQTLAKLALQQEKFMNKQIQTTQEFEKQKEQIFANDRKRQSYNKQREELQLRNLQRRDEIKEKQEKLKIKKSHLEDIRTNIKKFQVYQQFLKELRNLSEDFGPSDIEEFSVMSILARFKTMQKKKIELFEVHHKIEQEKQKRTRAIQEVHKQREQKNYEYGLRIKDLKEKIDYYNQQNLTLQSELEGQLNQNGQKQREFGQVIFSIRGLYLSILGEEKQSRSIIDMLSIIRDQRKKLKEYLDLYQRKVEEGKKTLQKKDNL